MLQTETVEFVKLISGWSNDGVSISGDMLTDVLEKLKANPSGNQIASNIVRNAGDAIKNVKKLVNYS